MTHDQVHEENFKIGTSGDRCACENMYIYVCVCVLLYIQDISLWCQRASDILLMFMKGHRNNKGPLTS